LVASLIPSDERSKLDPKEIKCFFVGYAETQEGFRLYEPISRKVKISRDVIFHEHEKCLSNNTARSTNSSDFDCADDSLSSSGDKVSANEPTHLEHSTGTTPYLPCSVQLPSKLIVANPNSSTHVTPDQQPLDNNPPSDETMEDSHHHDEIDSDSDPFYGFTPVRRSQRTEKK
jgi:hypothetical protein